MKNFGRLEEGFRTSPKSYLLKQEFEDWIEFRVKFSQILELQLRANAFPKENFVKTMIAE